MSIHCTSPSVATRTRRRPEEAPVAACTSISRKLKLRTLEALPSQPTAARSTSPIMARRPSGSSAMAARAPPSSTAWPSSTPTCSNCNALLPTKSVGVRSTCVPPPALTLSVQVRKPLSSVASAAPKATQRLRPKRALKSSRSSSMRA